MRPGFEPGIVREVEVLVTEGMCPAFDGLLVHRVFSTWSVAHYFEIAARKVLVDYLDPDEEGIGSYVSVEHIAPCRVGRTVTVRGTLAEVSHSRHVKVVCELEAREGERLLARGKQVQVVMKKEHLQRYLERH